ncbi:ArsR/SmtB family transcription factor [Corynebacterium falsenii]|uniref:ArsR/SmtB family transcription factor n=1 Tax=Corynebacterium falsenii TaxID=108486 RepID=UPI003FCFE20F
MTASCTPNECCSLIAGPLSESEATSAASLFKTLGDPTRLRIISYIASEGCEPMNVSALAEALELTQPTVSHHVRKLCEAGLVQRRQVGRSVQHIIVPDAFQTLQTVLAIG